MNELHWTGAALLLALAVWGGGTGGRERGVEVSWDEFAREHDLRDEAPAEAPTAAPRAPQPSTAASRPRAIGRPDRSRPGRPRRGAAEDTLALARPSTRVRATATCLHCGRDAGELEWDAAAPWQPAHFCPADGSASKVTALGARMRCTWCGGSVFVDDPRPVPVRSRLSQTAA